MSKHAITLWALFLFLIPRDAWAYLDPGTGSLILQAVVASLFAGLLTIRLYWRRLKAYIFYGKNQPVEELLDCLPDGVEDDA